MKKLHQSPAYVSGKQANIDQELIAEVGKTTNLPQDEKPTVATVNDVNKLQNEGPVKDFFKEAKLGDKVLIYSKAQKIILYRPGDHKVVAVSTLTPSSK